MSNYTKTTNFASKDNLSPGNPLKIVKGAEIDTEFNNIQTAVATKTDNASANITGGSITGITDLAIADGGTGASTATAALNNLLPSQTGNATKYLQTDGSNATWDAVSLSTSDITGTLPVANGGTGVTSSTGTGSVVLSNSPTLVTPALGTPASATLTNATGLPISTGVSGLGTGVASFLATPSSANLASAVSDETGSGALVFANSPTLVTPALGTPSSGTLTNATGLPISTGVSGLGTGVATFLATPSSANLISAVTDETGTGSLVFANSPTLVTPALGTPSSATLTNATGLPIATGVSGLGTGVATALAVNVGSSGAPLVNGGVLGTPSSGTATNLTGLPLSTGVTGTLPVANGGTGQTSYTNGQLLIGNTTGNTLTKATLTAGSGISITNGGGSITIAASGGGGSGDVVGPSSATDNGIALFDGTTGKLLKNSSAQDGLIHGLTVGRGAGAVSTNTAVGASALAANSSGIQTVAVGANAAQYQTNNNNTAVGYNSLVGVSGSSNGGSNTAVGSNSLAGLTSGNFNTAIGQQALVANTTASNNTAVGYQAGYTNTTGGANTFIGRLSGYNNTTASENTAIGNSALYWNSTGTNNVAIGTSALSTGAGSAGSHGDFNVAVGVSALNLNRGGNSTAVGYSALGNNSTGTDNTAVGRQTLQANTTGYSNTALGIYALYSNTTAINNTAVGREAGYTNTTGTGGVFVGRGAGYSSNASYSTYLGDTAGYSTTGTSNTFVGNGSGYAVTSGTKNTILGMYNGNQSYLGDIRTLSNHIVLSDGDGVTGFWINAAGRPFLPGLGSDAGTNAVRFNTGTGRLSYDTSSARYKDNIRDSIYGLSHVMQMRSTQFEYKEGGRSDVGLIAEELQPIVPELVGVNKEGQADSVSYDRMVSVLVKAIQELKAEFDAYKATHP